MSLHIRLASQDEHLERLAKQLGDSKHSNIAVIPISISLVVNAIRFLPLYTLQFVLIGFTKKPFRHTSGPERIRKPIAAQTPAAGSYGFRIGLHRYSRAWYPY